MIVVLDSGVWISAFHFGGIPLSAVNHAFLHDEIAVCAEIIGEVTTVLTSKFGWNQKDVRSILDGYLNASIDINVQNSLKGVCRDPKDDMLFECAVQAQAEIIVSGDKDVLDVGEYRGIRVLSARQYVANEVQP